MGKVLFVNGSPNEHGCTATAMEEMISSFASLGIETEMLWLGKKNIPDCIACFSCQQNGKCIFDDEVNAIGSRMDEFDGIVIGSPVYYGGPNGRITSFMDRLVFSVPNDKLAGKFTAAIVSCRRGGATAAFERLNQYFLMTNMHVVSSQYWNQVHGYTAEDVRKDLEGLQTMRTLAQNMAYLIKLKENGDASGIKAPTYEPTTYTDFIR